MAEELKKKIFDLLHELPQKQGELDQLRQQCDSEQLSKQQLTAEIEGLKVEVSSLRAQLELTNKALRQCEENCKVAQEGAVRHRLAAEAATRTQDSIKAEAIRLHSENIMLKKQLEQLEKDVKAESFFRESCTLKQSKVQATIESLTNQMRGLEKDFRDVERQTNSALSVGNKSKQLVENKDKTINQLEEKNKCLSDQIISLTSELKNLQMSGNGNKSVEQHYVKDILKEWQNSMNEMNLRTQCFEKETESLHQSLEMALEAQLKLQMLEAAATEKVRELEAHLQAIEQRESKSYMDTSVQTELAASADVGCQTPRMEVKHAATQSDFLDLQIRENFTKEVNTNYTNHGDQNVTAGSASTATSTSSINKYSSSSVSQLISKFKKVRARQESEEMEIRLSQSQEDSELPTQPNMNLYNRNK